MVMAVIVMAVGVTCVVRESSSNDAYLPVVDV